MELEKELNEAINTRKDLESKQEGRTYVAMCAARKPRDKL